MYHHFVVLGFLFGFLLGKVHPSCYDPPSDLCDSRIPEIHSLETRDPSYMVNKKTIHWTYCDVYAIDTHKWYKSESNMSTSCPYVHMCGAKFPIWMTGENPRPEDGLVNRTSCVRGFYHCCYDTYKLTALNCGDFIAYCFVDLPYGCHQRYCFDTGKVLTTTSESTQTNSVKEKSVGTTTTMRYEKSSIDRDPTSSHKLSQASGTADRYNLKTTSHSRIAVQSTVDQSTETTPLSVSDITTSDAATSICFSSTSDICKTYMPTIPSLETRDPLYKFTNDTSNWQSCDVYAIDTNKWYRSRSKMTTSCPLVQTCGTKFPIWMKGSNPKPRHGLVNRTSCVRGFNSCCHNTYQLTAVNCRRFMAYCFVDLPYGCHQRYCFDNKRASTHKRKLSQRSRISNKKTVRSPHSMITKQNMDDSSIEAAFGSRNTHNSTIGPSYEAKVLPSPAVKASESNSHKLLTLALIGIGLTTATIFVLLTIVIRRKRSSKVYDKVVQSNKTCDT